MASGEAERAVSTCTEALGTTASRSVSVFPENKACSPSTLLADGGRLADGRVLADGSLLADGAPLTNEAPGEHIERSLRLRELVGDSSSAAVEAKRKISLGGAAEFLLTGGATPLVIGALALLRTTWPIDDATFAVGFTTFYLAYVVNDPHFAVTYVLFYRRAKERALSPSYPLAQRIRYWTAGLAVPLALLSWCGYALSVRSAEALGGLFQLMFFLVSWHYVKQGLGVLVMLSARGGLRFSPAERRLILAHAIAAWLYARATPFDPGSPFLEQGVFYHSLRHPSWFEPVTRALFVVSALGLVVALGSFFKREGRLPPLAALFGFLCTVLTWVVFPSLDPLFVYVIPLLHSLQYLYFVGLREHAEGRHWEGEPHFGRPAALCVGLLAASALGLGWVLFHGLPDALDDVLSLASSDPLDPLGPTPWLAACFAFVNLHHYFMDAVIWRREVPEVRYLTIRP